MTYNIAAFTFLPTNQKELKKMSCFHSNHNSPDGVVSLLIYVKLWSAGIEAVHILL